MLGPAVLLVDDDLSTLDLLAYALRGKGYRILQASDGSEALEASSGYKGPIPLLLTDIAMPGLNGLELAKRIRLERPETKVIYVSAYRHLFDVGKEPLIDKPFTPDQLLIKVREVLSSDPQGGPRRRPGTG